MITVRIEWVDLNGDVQVTEYDTENRVELLEFIEQLIDTGLTFEVKYR